MVRAALLVLMCANIVRADECEELCKPPPEALDPQVRDELYTGIGLIIAGHAVGLLAALSLNLSASERALSTVPVFGAIEGAARAGDRWDVRMTLVFSAGVQVVGILLAATAWATRNDFKRASFDPTRMTLNF
jgi:hypothetical protein